MVPAVSGLLQSRSLATRTSHPWITYRAPVRALVPQFWMMMGSAESKCVHIQRSPLKPELAQRLHRTSITKGARATTAIEGNTLTEEQVEQAVSGTLDTPPSQEYLKREVDNVIKLFNDLTRRLVYEEERLDLSLDWLNHLNRELLADTELREGVVPGEVRTHSVVVGGYRGAPAEDCSQLLELLCEWINGPELRPPSGGQDEPPAVERFYSAFLRATLAHLYIAWIHPYGDGNGRLARLVEFAILIDAGVPMTAAHLLSHHYNLTRSRYYTRLDASSREANGSGDGAAAFVSYAAEGFVDQLAEQLVGISQAVFDTTWREYIYDNLPAGTEAERRQRKLVLALPSGLLPVSDWAIRSEIPTLTAELAQLYAGKGPRTVARDLNRLFERGVIVRTEKSVAANRQLLTHQMPPTARDFDDNPLV